ncbi:MAG TPA: hypothetical protein VFN10_03815 [Thermoanaerobaculia bacterium]|nr:hypothetical protein [Thermoanaerobaculia bacterium]
MRGEERREFQRLLLDPPLAGTYGSASVRIVEIGVLGARIAHSDPTPPSQAELRFTYEDAEITLRCDAVRTRPANDGYESGLRFRAALGESGDRLRHMLGTLVLRELEARRDATMNARMTIQSVDGDKTVRGIDAQFLSYRYENGVWRKRRVFLPEQPAVGFTVAAATDEGETHRLCTVYEASDEEGRRLIRLFAELSVSGALEIPPRV